ncbi:IclR family transcriptional regulator [Qaidamihabitans albus]|uniref:IclR family transcriptional regulator n=1 Tax=Qaidamihabitans albus TaxID=2795733 RepID=UPI0018F182FC|nr:IclR family transcriptional regulator [Qaidamihabitans albus]
MAEGDLDTVGKASRLLVHLGTVPDGATLSELSRATGFPPPSTHRLLASLRRQDFVAFDPESKRYALGLRLFQLGAAVSSARGFTGIAVPVMRRLSETTGEATLMSVRDGHHQLYIHHVEARHNVVVKGETGKLGPLHCTSMGKVLIAFADYDTREELIENVELERFTPRTIVDRPTFRHEIGRVRAQGFAVADEEHELGIRAIGVPVLGPLGTAVAALSVPSPAYRNTLAAAMRFLPPLRDAAEQLSVLLPHT